MIRELYVLTSPPSLGNHDETFIGVFSSREEIVEYLNNAYSNCEFISHFRAEILLSSNSLIIDYNVKVPPTFYSIKSFNVVYSDNDDENFVKVCIQSENCGNEYFLSNNQSDIDEYVKTNTNGEYRSFYFQDARIDHPE